MTSLTGRLGIRWNRVERALAPLVKVLFVYSIYLGGLLGLMQRDDANRYINLASADQQVMVLACVLAGAVLLFLVGLVLRRFKPDCLAFQYLGALYFSLALVWAGYVVGTQTLTTGVVLIGAALAGYIALESAVILTGLVVSFALILLINVGVTFGQIPFAPLLVPPTDIDGATFWVHLQLFIAAPNIIMYLGLISLMIHFWRKREAELLALSLTDGLTQLPNRRGILEQLQRANDCARRDDEALSVVILDLDGFKQINDRWGHPTGDRVLQAAADCLRQQLRPNDQAGRFGGEEFLLLLPATDSRSAAELVEACRRALEKLVVFSDSGVAIPVRASFGIASTSDLPDSHHDSLIHAADKALYLAKDAGRNCAIVADASMHTPTRYSTSPERGRPRSRKAILESLIRGDHYWTPVRRATLANGMQLAQFSLYVGWALLLMIPANRDQLINVDQVLTSLPWVAMIYALFAINIAIGRRLARSRHEPPWFMHLSHWLVALSLVYFGYLIGTLSLPVGVVLMGGPLFGLLFFRARYIYPPLLGSLALLVLLSYAGARQWIPYAPILPEPLTPYAPVSLVWAIGAYLFITPHLYVIVWLAQKTFGHWREQGKAVRHHGRTDPLTGVHNRRSICALLDKELAQTQRQGPPLAVVLLDLDHFKQINDQYGHPCGDRTLTLAAAALSECARENDVIGRFGGEEFMLLLPDTTPEGAHALAERCRIRLSRLRVKTDSGDTASVTASFGVSCSTPHGHITGTELIRLADNALYRAKHAGRNRVEIEMPSRRTQLRPATESQ